MFTQGTSQNQWDWFSIVFLSDILNIHVWFASNQTDNNRSEFLDEININLHKLNDESLSFYP